MSSSENKKRTEGDGGCAASKLKKCILDTHEAVALCLSNRFSDARAHLEPCADDSMYHALGFATIAYLQAIMTYEQENIEMAYKSVKRASEVCDSLSHESRYIVKESGNVQIDSSNVFIRTCEEPVGTDTGFLGNAIEWSRRKTTWTESLYSWVGRPYFDEYTEEEIHAELCYAECLLERAILTFIQDENLINFIKGGLKIRNAYHLYKSCLMLMKQCPKSLSQSTCRDDFEGGVHLGVGTFNLLLSLLPARVLRLLEWVGFSGNKLYGLKHLNEGVEKIGIRSPLCAVTLLGYHIVISPILGIGDTDVEFAENILKSCLSEYPEGAIFLFYQGRLSQIQGHLSDAIACYNRSVTVNVDWKQVHHVCFWELMWCHSFQCEWSKAASYASTLAKESKWSKTAYLYLEASFRMMASMEGQTDDSLPNDGSRSVDELLRLVPEYKQRIAGKSLPFEKFAVYKAKKYFDSKRPLLLPGLELIYVWNGFTMFGGKRELVNKMLALVLDAQTEVNDRRDSNQWYIDDYCLCKLLQGMCLRYLGYPEDAEGCFRDVMGMNNAIVLDSYLAPFASAEIAFLYKSLGRLNEAIEQFEYTRKHFTGYHLESRLHFRLHSNLQAIKDSMNGDKAIPSNIEEECLGIPQPAGNVASVSPRTAKRETTV